MPLLSKSGPTDMLSVLPAVEVCNSSVLLRLSDRKASVLGISKLHNASALYKQHKSSHCSLCSSLSHPTVTGDALVFAQKNTTAVNVTRAGSPPPTPVRQRSIGKSSADSFCSRASSSVLNRACSASTEGTSGRLLANKAPSRCLALG